jgi:hypothetical protein
LGIPFLAKTRSGGLAIRRRPSAVVGLRGTINCLCERAV